jgi:hypothetical protein
MTSFRYPYRFGPFNFGASGPPTPPAPTIINAVRYWFKSTEGVFNTGTTPATNGQTVQNWRSEYGSYLKTATQATSGLRPTYNTVPDRLTANGVDTRMQPANSYVPTYLTAQEMPDAEGAEPGEGFTCTGACYIPSSTTVPAYNDCFAVANFGAADLSVPAGDRTPSIVFVSKDGATKLGEIILSKTSFPSWESLQGIAYHEATEQLYVTSGTEDLVRVFDIDSDGTVAADSWASTDPNGLCIDQDTDQVYVITADGVMNRYNLDGTGATARATLTRTGSGVIDHLAFDAQKQAIYASWGGASAEGQIAQYFLFSNTWLSSGNDTLLTGAYSIEGIVHIDGVLYTFCDGYYHVTANGNELRTYTWGGASDRVLVEFNAFMTVRLTGAPSTTSAFWVHGEPLANPGFGIFASLSTTTELRIYINGAAGTTQRITTTVACADLTTVSVIRFYFNLDTNIARVYQNGVQIGSDIDCSIVTSAINFSNPTLFNGDVSVSNRCIPGEIRELVMCAGSLSTEDAATITTELMTNAGL